MQNSWTRKEQRMEQRGVESMSLPTSFHHLVDDFDLNEFNQPNFETESNSSVSSTKSIPTVPSIPSRKKTYQRVSNGDDEKQTASQNSNMLSLKHFPSKAIKPSQTSTQEDEYVASESMMNYMYNTRKKKSKGGNSQGFTAATISYRGTNIYQAASQGALPVCVLLWGIASAKKVRLMVPDDQGNNPMHHAAQADSAEVLSFLMQQSKGVLDEFSGVKLMQSRNTLGETPLLRAMSAGHIPVVRALLEEGSDPFVFDHQSNTIFMVLAKHGFLWCLNFAYRTLCTSHGAAVTLDLLSCLDSEGHSALDWAADAGDVNLLEFLIKAGLNPYRVDSCNRGPLFWAVKNGRVAAVRFLVLVGCDPYKRDTQSQSPIGMASSMYGRTGNGGVLSAMRRFRRDMTQIPTRESINNNRVTLDQQTPIRFYRTRKTSCSSFCCWKEDDTMESTAGALSTPKESFAVYRKDPSRLGHTLFYTIGTYGIWITAVWASFYFWVPFIVLFFFSFRFIVRRATVKLKSYGRDRSRIGTIEDYLSCPEKGLGLYLGSFLIVLTYLLACVAHEDVDHLDQKYVEYLLDIRGVSAAAKDTVLFWIGGFFVMLSFAFWLKIAWIDTNPGKIDTRWQDFNAVMNESQEAMGPPASERFCRTTLVRKPLRSKYCTHVGFVVPRMDHYCQWLNNSIGFDNHRTFISFLVSHLVAVSVIVILMIRALHRELGYGMVCSLIEELLSREYLLVTALLAFLTVTLICLTLLTAEQLYNIATNMTINERINWYKYSWLRDADGQGRCNKFDRGVVLNTLEFLRIKGYDLDYSNVFETWDSFPHIATSTSESNSSNAEHSRSNYSSSRESAPMVDNMQGASTSSREVFAVSSTTATDGTHMGPIQGIDTSKSATSLLSFSEAPEQQLHGIALKGEEERRTALLVPLEDMRKT